MKGLKVPKYLADYIRRILLKHSLINLNMKIKRLGDFVIVPVNKNLDSGMLEKIGIYNVEIIETDFEIQNKAPRSLKDYLKGLLEEGKIDEIKRSFDIIGDIVILEIPDDLEEEKNQIGEAALKFTRRKAVFRKKSKIKGIKRTRELEHIAGEEISETTHKEYGCRYMLDVRKVYFSPRLATERERISNQVRDGELIIDMFAGVGSFSIAIAKKHEVEIYAVDINEDAYNYLKQNIQLNKVQERIIPIFGDVFEFLEDKNMKADRIIMNLPGSAWKFLEIAIKSVKSGGIIHYYEFACDFEKAIEKLKNAAYPRKVKILNKRKVKSKSPGMWHIGVDALVF
ncbi:MAG: class I SAM-dependent methyltransferase family protein [Euryarchaeota archaeon]|nr:class I SAM-dependent methyltransferase family protein [Euryarchaeota archaeon]